MHMYIFILYIHSCVFICIFVLYIYVYYTLYMNVGVGSPVTVRNDEVASTIGTWERVRRGGGIGVSECLNFPLAVTL